MVLPMNDRPHPNNRPSGRPPLPPPLPIIMHTTPHCLRDWPYASPGGWVSWDYDVLEEQGPAMAKDFQEHCSKN
jgi:hypothetical protein